VILFDEFDSGIRIREMNNYLDGYPLMLPARYNDKVACFERVYIISNIDLCQQYMEKVKCPITGVENEIRAVPDEIWHAFIRRIHNVIHFMPDGTWQQYDAKEYLREFSTDAQPKPQEEERILTLAKYEEVTGKKRDADFWLILTCNKKHCKALSNVV